MIDRSLELEYSLGNGLKIVEHNEDDTVIIQRRSIRVKNSMRAGETIEEKDIEFLRPCPKDAISPHNYEEIIGKTLKENKAKGDHIRLTDV